MKYPSELDALERLFDGYHVDKDYVPQGLKSLLYPTFDSNHPHWIISKDKISGSNGVPKARVSTPPRVSRKPKPSEDLDLTGSPLKCSFSMNEELNEEDDDYLQGINNGKGSECIYVPMSPQEARNLLGKVNTGSGLESSSDAFPLIICLVQGNETLWAIGSLKAGSSISMFEISYEDSKVASKLLSYDKLLDRHRTFVSSSAMVESFVSSEYNVVSDYEDFSEIRLFFRWSKPKALLENPSPSADVSLSITLRPGDEKLSTYPNWDQLNLLRGFIAGLSNQGIPWRQRSEGEPGLKEELLGLLDKVKNLNPRSNQGLTDVSAVVETEGDIDDRIGVITDNTRHDVDFTDLLWCTLHKVESFDELIFSLSMILQTLKTDEIRPFIYSRNDTKICRIVQNIVRGSKDPVPEMSGRLPLDIIIEIGIEKLKRDYIHTLITNDLASQDDIKSLICKLDDKAAESNDLASQDDIKSLICKLDDKAAECENLLRLHYVYELVLLAQTFLSLGQDDLRTMVSQALKQLSKGPISWEEVELSISLQSSHFRNQLNKMKPVAWQVRFKTSTVKETICRFSIEPAMPFVINSTANTQDSSDSEFSYHNSVMSVITRNL